jgi:nucleoside-diphosphate-sugar epimerase
MNTPTRALVTGGAGFIGSHLVAELLARGTTVRVLDNLSSGFRKNLPGGAEFVEGDIRDLDTCRRACDGVGVVYHQAAVASVPRSLELPAASIESNVTGTANIFTAARDAGIERVVYASSSSVYGDDETLPKREAITGRPLSPYALSKWMCEELADTYARCYGMKFAGLRYFNVFGPRQDPNGPYAAAVPKFFAACRAGEAPTIFGDGKASRDFTYVGDVVNANILAAGAALDGAEAFNIGAGGATSVTDLALAIIRVTGAKVTPKYIDPRQGDILHSLADVSRARERLGFSAAVGLEEGLARTDAAERAQ